MTISAPDLAKLAVDLRKQLDSQKPTLIYAYNGTGKTLLSVESKNIGKCAKQPDTLYYNAYTEDLFTWNNDLRKDRYRYLRITRKSDFFAGAKTIPSEDILRHMSRYTAVRFEINYQRWTVTFQKGSAKHIKISRGEQSIFIWCFFLAVLEAALNGHPDYRWVEYVYIDDPISSLDEANILVVANHLAEIAMKAKRKLPTVISTHHGVFFEKLRRELRVTSFHLRNDQVGNCYTLVDLKKEKPFLHHLAALAELKKVCETRRVERKHFNMLRGVMEQTAVFHGLKDWKDCITTDDTLHSRLLDSNTHGDYLISTPSEVSEREMDYFKRILGEFAKTFQFEQTSSR